MLLWPVGAVLDRAWSASASWPRRVPDLARFTRRAYFRRLQPSAAAWADASFERIEQHLPWLDRAGRCVYDRCETNMTSNPFSFPRDPPRVTCRREITVVYGFDGDLRGRLTEVADCVSTAGWGDLRGGPEAAVPDMAERAPPVWPLAWAPVPDFALPGGLETMPPERRFPLESWLRMGIGWASRSEPAELVTTRETSRSGDPRTATATYRPVEIAGDDSWHLAAQALARHEHVLAIRVDITYYKNANVNARPGRLRKKVLPAWAIRPR
jgi:hypothetical protein